MSPSMSEGEIEGQPEYISVKHLLKQVYAAHIAKVRDLESQVKSLNYQLEVSKREAQQNSKIECEKCKEMQYAFTACKEYQNALLEQTERLKELELKFSSIDKSNLESKEDEPRADPVVPSTTDSVNDALTFSNWDESLGKIDNLESCTTPSNDKHSAEIVDVDETVMPAIDMKVVPSKTLLNRRKIFGYEKNEMQSPSSDSSSLANDCNEDVVLVPDTLDISHKKKSPVFSLSLKRLKKNRNIDVSSPENKENSSCIDPLLKTLSSGHPKKRALADLTVCQTQNKRFSSEQIKDIIKKDSEILITKDVTNHKEVSNCEVASSKNLEDLSRSDLAKEFTLFVEACSRKNLNSEVPKKTVPMKKVTELLKEAEGWASNFEDFDIDNTQQSLSIISGNKKPKQDFQTVDEDFQSTSTTCKVDETGSWKTSSKRCSQKKAQAMKMIKSSSRFKMTLEVPNTNWKKPSYKQTKLTTGAFINKNHSKSEDCTETLNSVHDSNKQTFSLGEKSDCSSLGGVTELAALASLDFTCVPGDISSPIKSSKQNPLVPEMSHRNAETICTIEEVTVDNRKAGRQCSSSNAEVEIIDENEPQGDAVSNEAENLEVAGDHNSFDRLPVPQEPDYKYKEDTVRGKGKRKQLLGFECKECEKYYSDLGLSEEEKKERMQQCSRHRAKYVPPQTPEHFWELDFPDTEECKARGYVAETQKVKLKSRRRRPLAGEGN